MLEAVPMAAQALTRTPVPGQRVVGLGLGVTVGEGEGDGDLVGDALNEGLGLVVCEALAAG